MRMSDFFGFAALGFGRLVRLPFYGPWLFASA
ncbi:Uncharacterised protein [Comamonas terrigena]|nr:Uncharacterised protein [Comamonas terrigena]